MRIIEAEGHAPEIQSLIDAAYDETINGDFGPGQKQLIAEVVIGTLARLRASPSSWEQALDIAYRLAHGMLPP